jgi:hypothetical protein
MAPTTTFDLQEVTKEQIAELYYSSLGPGTMRTNHVLLSIHGPNPSPADIESDFACWFGGVCSLAKTIDPTVSLFTTKDMLSYLNHDKARESIKRAA